MVYDEEKGAYAPRFGFKKADDPANQWVMEHNNGDGINVYIVM